MPNVDEQDDAERLLTAEPVRPVSLYLARVLGEVYGVELEQERGEPIPYLEGE